MLSYRMQVARHDLRQRGANGVTAVSEYVHLHWVDRLLRGICFRTERLLHEYDFLRLTQPTSFCLLILAWCALGRSTRCFSKPRVPRPVTYHD